jgi:hypothetical protein
MASVRPTEGIQRNTCGLTLSARLKRRSAGQRDSVNELVVGGKRMAGTPLKKLFPDGLCGAKTRKGYPCRMRMVVRCKNGKLRCKFHGGASTGPKTQAGKMKVALNLPNGAHRRAKLS